MPKNHPPTPPKERAPELEPPNGASPAPESTSEPESSPEPQIMVGFTLAEVDEMKAELAKTRAEAQRNLDGWQRALADFSNLKRRLERDQVQMQEDASGAIIKKFLDVLDDLELALKNSPKEGEGAAWANGLELIYRKLQTALENQGVRVMETEGQLFDPHFHEAISQEPSDNHQRDEIIEVLKPGYLIGDRVLRPALVRVAA